MAEMSKLTVTGLNHIRGERCAHPLAFMRVDDGNTTVHGNLTVGCPLCHYRLDQSDDVIVITADVATIYSGNVSDLIAQQREKHG